MISQRDAKDATILNAAAAASTGTGFDVSRFRHLVVSVGTASSANLTVKFQGSIQITQPDFSAAQSVSNHWDYVQGIDLEDGSALDGDTGFVVTGTDDFKNYEVNVNGLRWFDATVTARSAGSVTVKVLAFKD